MEPRWFQVYILWLILSKIVYFSSFGNFEAL
nr:MAG TPA: hypothetical protein [Caudoviricetes sp.]